MKEGLHFSSQVDQKLGVVYQTTHTISRRAVVAAVTPSLVWDFSGWSERWGWGPDIASFFPKETQKVETCDKNLSWEARSRLYGRRHSTQE